MALGLTMEISCTAALRDVELATKARRLVEQDSREAQEVQAQAIRTALAAGCSASQLAERTGCGKLQSRSSASPGCGPHPGV